MSQSEDLGETVIPFGRHKGQKMSAIQRDYLEFIVENKYGPPHWLKKIAAFLWPEETAKSGRSQSERDMDREFKGIIG